MHKLHHYLMIALTIFAAIFILQNMQIVVVDILFWQINMPSALLIAVVLAIGVLFGLLLRFGKHKEKAAAKEPERD
ncbi:MAG: LapA family protein [Paraglaciecola sp.]|uniref:LapA family protein n=1 Tax=Paraglaciecola sp. TaxID=1920173 RepID=UPI00273F446E|nr:LapA family protein [Paraglaciecola sp.]MDP5032185.1 LapA family protein [Paraglaciecola sp.]MDP5133081.1 LapA family protein [Paraglaciecola sp.]